MAEALAASDKGSYSEQDKLLKLDCLDKEEDEVVPVFSASCLNICPIIIPKYVPSCFLNSFVSQPLRSPLRPQFSQNIPAPCLCRRFTGGLHFPHLWKIQKALSFAVFTE